MKAPARDPWSPNHWARVQTPEVFVEDMAAYFDSLTWSRITGETSAVIGDIMELVRQHQARARDPDPLTPEFGLLQALL